jgi:hypothetical protein
MKVRRYRILWPLGNYEGDVMAGEEYPCMLRYKGLGLGRGPTMVDYVYEGSAQACNLLDRVTGKAPQLRAYSRGPRSRQRVNNAYVSLNW